MTEFYTEKRIKIPEGCNVTINKKLLTLEYNGKKISRDFVHVAFTMEYIDEHIRLSLWNSKRQERSKIVTCASHIKNMILWITKGYEYILKAAYVHFPISFDIQDNGKKILVKNFLGEKTSRVFNMLGESVVKIGSDKDTIVISGISLENVSHSAGNIQDRYRPKNFDNRKFIDGVYISAKRLIGE